MWGLASSHRYMWAAEYFRQSTECTSPASLNVISLHLLNLDEALKQLVPSICPKDAKSDLENLTLSHGRQTYGNTKGIALFSCVIQSLGCKPPGKPCQKMESIELGLNTFSDNVVDHCDKFDRINTEFELHAPSADECERLRKPIVDGLVKKGKVVSSPHFTKCYEALMAVQSGSFETPSISCYS